MSSKYALNHDGLICQYCGKECKNRNSLAQHERLCKENPNKQENPFVKYHKDNPHPWNYGLSKETDIRVKNSSMTYLKNETLGLHKQNFGVASTVERELQRRAKISATAKANPECGGNRQGSGRGKKGWYKGYFCDSTYELVYIIYNIDHNIKFKRFDGFYYYSYNNELHKYYPDFELEDGNLIEIKGYHTEVVDIKIKSVFDRKIKVLYENDLKFAFDYVKNTYKYDKLEDLYEKLN